jgi:hypothetical protein
MLALRVGQQYGLIAVDKQYLSMVSCLGSGRYRSRKLEVFWLPRRKRLTSIHMVNEAQNTTSFREVSDNSRAA